jgi:AraC-like DNA-binding protein
LLSFFVVKETLQLPEGFQGRIWPHRFAGQSFAAHRHDELEINLVTGGRAIYLLGDRRYELRRGDLVWLFPEQDHVLLNQTTDYTMWILVFKPELVSQVSTQTATQTLREQNPSGDFCRRIGEHQSTRLTALYEEVMAAGADLDRYNAGLSYALTMSWAAHCASAHTSPFSGVHPCVELAAKLLRDEAHPLDLPQLARRVGMSTSRLSRLFKAQTGVSLSAFRNRQRVERFVELYADGKSTLHEAALEAGFGSYPQFHRVFKEVMGHAPARHRKNIEEARAVLVRRQGLTGT